MERSSRHDRGLDQRCDSQHQWTVDLPVHWVFPISIAKRVRFVCPYEHRFTTHKGDAEHETAAAPGNHRSNRRLDAAKDDPASTVGRSRIASDDHDSGIIVAYLVTGCYV